MTADLLQHIEKNKQAYINDLKEIVEITSMSQCVTKWQEVNKAIQWFGGRLQKIGTTPEYFEVAGFETCDGSRIKCPSVLFATVGNDPQKKTILVYGHLDVALATMDEGWERCPFQFVQEGDLLHGRGTSANKGPLLCWLHVLETYNALKKSLPVNVKLIVEGMFENGSEGLESFCSKQKEFFGDIYCVVTTNSNWLTSKKPCIVYGQRGICYFTLEVSGLNRNVCSKRYGGGIHEPMFDLLYMLDALQDKDGKIIIPGVMDDVLAPTKADQEALEKITVDVNEMKAMLGSQRLAHAEKGTRILMHRWHLPALVLHGIEGGFSGKGKREIIPGKVTGKFSIQIVENQAPEKIHRHVSHYLENLCKLRGSPNGINVQMVYSAPPLVENRKDECYAAAGRAMKKTYSQEPDFVRQGSTIPMAGVLKNITGKPVVMLCVGGGSDNVQGPNEKISATNYMDGHKLVAAFMNEISV